jgi:hypothetical protein
MTTSKEITLNNTDLIYKEVASIEAYGKRAFGIKILVAAPFELSQGDDAHLFHQAEEMKKLLELRAQLRDPTVQKDIALEKDLLIDCFDGEKIYVKAIPNEYGERPHYPWFAVTTSKGVIKIGWRHRVINIDWSESDIKKTGKELFPEEDVTRGENYIHAWGYEKAQEYLHKLLG